LQLHFKRPHLGQDYVVDQNLSEELIRILNFFQRFEIHTRSREKF